MIETLAQGREEAHSPERRPIHRKKLVSVAGLVAIIMFIAIWIRVSTTSAHEGSRTSVAPGPCAQPYPGKQPTDVCADIPGRPPLKGLNVSAQPLKVRANVTVEGERICSLVTIYNFTGRDQNYSPDDFTLQFPSGGVSTTNFLDRTLGTGDLSRDLGSGVLSRDAAASGEVCVPYPGESGEYVLIYHPHPPFQIKRVTWIFTM